MKNFFKLTNRDLIMKESFKKVILLACLLSTSQIFEPCILAGNHQSKEVKKENGQQVDEGTPKKKYKKNHFLRNAGIVLVGGTIVYGSVRTVSSICSSTSKGKKPGLSDPKKNDKSTDNKTIISTSSATVLTPSAIPLQPPVLDVNPVEVPTSPIISTSSPQRQTQKTDTTTISTSASVEREETAKLIKLLTPQSPRDFLDRHFSNGKGFLYSGKKLTEFPMIFGQNREKLQPLRIDCTNADECCQEEIAYNNGAFDGALNLIRGCFPENTKTGKLFWTRPWCTINDGTNIVPYDFAAFYHFNEYLTVESLNGRLGQIFTAVGKIERYFSQQNIFQIFYHGQLATLSVVQDILKLLILIKNGKEIKNVGKDYQAFIPLRDPNNQKFNDYGKTITDAFNAINCEDVLSCDRNHSDIIVSCGYNLFIPQYFTYSGEVLCSSPFNYFITASKGTGTKHKNWCWERYLRDVLTHYDIEAKYKAVHDFVANLIGRYKLDSESSLLQVIVHYSIEPMVARAVFCKVFNPITRFNNNTYESLQQIRLYAHPDYFCNPDDIRIRIYRYEKSAEFAQAVASDEYWNALIKLVTK